MPETVTPLTPAVEDYVKAIYTLESRDGEATTTALADRLELAPEWLGIGIACAFALAWMLAMAVERLRRLPVASAPTHS